MRLMVVTLCFTLLLVWAAATAASSKVEHHLIPVGRAVALDETVVTVVLKLLELPAHLAKVIEVVTPPTLVVTVEAAVAAQAKRVTQVAMTVKITQEQLLKEVPV